jgi:hypothetical protein
MSPPKNGDEVHDIVQKVREKERRDNATILFTTLVLQSSPMLFI